MSVKSNSEHSSCRGILYDALVEFMIGHHKGCPYNCTPTGHHKGYPYKQLYIQPHLASSAYFLHVAALALGGKTWYTNSRMIGYSLIPGSSTLGPEMAG